VGVDKTGKMLYNIHIKQKPNKGLLLPLIKGEPIETKQGGAKAKEEIADPRPCTFNFYYLYLSRKQNFMYRRFKNGK